MKLAKAIEILDLALKDEPPVSETDLIAAAKLLIEAGKRVNAHRNSSLQDAHILLPGETEDK